MKHPAELALIVLCASSCATAPDQTPEQRAATINTLLDVAEPEIRHWAADAGADPRDIDAVAVAFTAVRAAAALAEDGSIDSDEIVEALDLVESAAFMVINSHDGLSEDERVRRVTRVAGLKALILAALQ